MFISVYARHSPSRGYIIHIIEALNIFRGESLTVQSEKVYAAAWQERKVIVMMYTNSDPQCVTSVLRRQSNGSRDDVNCLLAIASYDKHMGGVDRGGVGRADQTRGYDHCRMKSKNKLQVYLLLPI